MAEINSIASLYLLWKYQRRRLRVHNIIQRWTKLLAVILYIIVYYNIKLRESANGNNYFLLHVAVQSGLQRLNADRPP